MKIDKKKIVTKNISLKIKEVQEENYIIRGVFSTGDEDRHGEIVDQKGWKLDEFMSNPVVLFAHDQYRPAVGKVIELKNDDGILEGAIQFAVKEDTSGLAETLYNLYKGRFMSAFSVGFENNLTEYNAEDDTIILKENTLYELSCVNVPANNMALAYSKGINIEPLERIENEIKKNLYNQITEDVEDVITKNIAEQIAKETSADRLILKNQKVETPTSKDGVYAIRKINKAIRDLIKQRNKIKYSK